MFHAQLARTQRNVSKVDIDLTAGLVDLIIRTPGTLVYFDRVTTGYAAVELNQEQYGSLDAMTLMSGDSVECPFQALKLNAPAQPGKTLRLMICNGVSIRGGSGLSTGGSSLATVVSSRASMTNTAKTVTSASGLLLAANPTRQYLLIQNNDATGIVYVNFGAGPATVANGAKVAPGASYEPLIIPTDAIYCIGSIASNANVLVIEGN